MTRVPNVAVLVVAAAMLAGCGPPHVGVFQPTAFYALRDHYRVRYVDDGVDERLLLSAAWILRDYGVDGAHHPTTMRLPRGRTLRDVDDLAFVHRLDGSEIDVRTLPLDPVMAERDLDRVLVDTLGTIGGDRFSGAEAVVRFVERGPIEVGGRPAYRAILDTSVASPDPQTGSRRAYVVILRPDRWRWDRGGEHSSTTGDPMIVAIALVAPPAIFDSHVAELESLLDRIDVHADE